MATPTSSANAPILVELENAKVITPVTIPQVIVPTPTAVILTTSQMRQDQPPATNYCLEGVTQVLHPNTTAVAAVTTKDPITVPPSDENLENQVSELVVKTPLKTVRMVPYSIINVKQFYAMKRRYMALKKRRETQARSAWMNDDEKLRLNREILNLNKKLDEKKTELTDLNVRMNRLTLAQTRRLQDQEKFEMEFNAVFPTINSFTLSPIKEFGKLPDFHSVDQVDTSFAPSTKAPAGRKLDFSNCDTKQLMGSLPMWNEHADKLSEELLGESIYISSCDSPCDAVHRM